MGPQPSGPSPHFHRSITESFYVLSGTVRLHDGRGWHDAGPGDFFHVPIGPARHVLGARGVTEDLALVRTPG
jgi:quercetin dioxygenase-like cupin family protein